LFLRKLKTAGMISFIEESGNFLLICPRKKFWTFWGLAKYFSVKSAFLSLACHIFSNSLLRKELSIIISFC
jgi:hypothetical protein